jgi:hypothetical protein
MNASLDMLGAERVQPVFRLVVDGKLDGDEGHHLAEKRMEASLVMNSR